MRISSISMHHLKRLPNINLNSELSPGLLLHYRNLFLSKIKFLKVISKRNTTQKNELHNNYKIYRNLVSTQMKRSKQNYYSWYIYFESNLINTKYLKRHQKYNCYEKLSITPTLLTLQNETTDNSKRITNIFNNYFSTIGKKTYAKIKYSHKSYTDYLTNKNTNLFFFSPPDKEKIRLILSSLDNSKANCP